MREANTKLYKKTATKKEIHRIKEKQPSKKCAQVALVLQAKMLENSQALIVFFNLQGHKNRSKSSATEFSRPIVRQLSSFLQCIMT